MGPNAYTSFYAGYEVGGGRYFRYVATSVKVPACQTVAANSAVANVVLYGGPNVAQLTVACGGGFDSVTFFDHTFARGFFHLTPGVGDVLRIGIFRDPATNRDNFSVTNTKTGRVQNVSVATSPSVIYRRANISAVIDNAHVTPPAADVMLWQFKDSRVTTFSGDRGSIVGPWTTFKVLDTTTGTVAGTVVMSPSALANSGGDFTLWLRH
ncbi:MAG TPA: hypothetical protein VNF47_16375 [Streptosporangiaceae bacterium]|nr:hypothetical protein [Streptosporangiaceae bacterium]